MSGDQATIEQYIATEGADEDDLDHELDLRSDTPPDGATTLFQWSDDPFVNEAVAELGRQLANEGLADIYPTQIVVAPDDPVDEATSFIERTIERALSTTHRRTAVAHQINAKLEELGFGSDDDRWVPPPDQPFPQRSDEEQSVYPDDTVDASTLEEYGLPPEDLEYVDEDESSLYTRSPTFVGNPSGHAFGYQFDRYQRYIETLSAALAGTFEHESPSCMNCGSEVMPTNKDIEGKKIEFNQSFNILASASGVSTPLGMTGRTTAHPGRCVGCLVAGFYYTLMPKVVRFKDYESRGGAIQVPVYHVFTPRGDFSELLGIRDDLNDILQDIDSPTEYDSTRRDTLEGVQTPSRGLQTLQFYEKILRHVNTVYEGDPYNFTRTHRPTALISYETAPQKSGNPIRDIRAVESIDPDKWAYRAISERTVTRHDEDGTPRDETYWPFADLLSWFGHLDDAPVAALDNIAYGILKRDLARLGRGMFEVMKTVERAQGQNASYPFSLRRAQDYFSFIMQQSTHTTSDSSIDDEAIESIKRVASNLGGTFYQRDDISVLIALQNANTPNEFLQAFEKASMQAQKKTSSDDADAQNWSGRDDVAQILKLINDPETFEPAKQMFVIHASLSAQYMNLQRGGNGGEDT